MPAANLSGAAILDAIKPELLRLYATAPAYGSLTFQIVFHAGDIVRVVQSAEISKQVKS